jgi:hypothetical protein
MSAEMKVVVFPTAAGNLDQAGEHLTLGIKRSNDEYPLTANLRLQRKSAFSRFPPVHRGGLEGQRRVELRRSRAIGTSLIWHSA